MHTDISLTDIYGEPIDTSNMTAGQLVDNFGLCNEVPEEMFTPPQNGSNAARLICNLCEVRKPCLDRELDRYSDVKPRRAENVFGVVAGLGVFDRVSVIEMRQAGATDEAVQQEIDRRTDIGYQKALKAYRNNTLGKSSGVGLPANWLTD
jgi:hypothetical protein